MKLKDFLKDSRVKSHSKDDLLNFEIELIVRPKDVGKTVKIKDINIDYIDWVSKTFVCQLTKTKKTYFKK